MKLSAFMGVPMGGFFDGSDVVFATLAPSVVAPKVPAETPTFPTKPVPIDKGTHTGKVSEATPIPTETRSPQEVATPPAIIQTEAASPTTPFVISTSDPFAALSQAVKNGSSLVVTPSSIPSSATHRPDVDLSSEGSEDVLEDPKDELVLKKRISDSDDEEDAPPETEFMGICLSPFFLFLVKSIPPPFFCHLFLTRMYLRLPFAAISFNLYVYFRILQRLLRGQGL